KIPVKKIFDLTPTKIKTLGQAILLFLGMAIVGIIVSVLISWVIIISIGKKAGIIGKKRASLIEVNIKTGEKISRLPYMSKDGRYSRDNRRIVYLQYSEDNFKFPSINIYDIETQKNREIVPFGENTCPTWYKNNKSILFVKKEAEYYDLWTVHTDSNIHVRLTNDSAVEAYPSVSPDGKWIAFTQTKKIFDSDKNTMRETKYLVLMPIDGKGKRILLKDVISEQVGWFPDSKRIGVAKIGSFLIVNIEGTLEEEISIGKDSIVQSIVINPVDESSIFLEEGIISPQLSLISLKTKKREKLPTDITFLFNSYVFDISKYGNKILYQQLVESIDFPIKNIAPPITKSEPKLIETDNKKIVKKQIPNMLKSFKSPISPKKFEIGKTYIADSNIIEMDIGKKTSKRIINNVLYNYQYSSDSKSIIYLSKDDNAMYTYNFNTKQKTNILPSAFTIVNYAWDSERNVVFYSQSVFRNGKKLTSILSFDINNKKYNKLASFDFNRRPIGEFKLSPDGKWIAFALEADYTKTKTLKDVYLLSVDGAIQRKLAEALNGGISWLADSKTIVCSQDYLNLSFIDINTKEVKKLSVDLPFSMANFVAEPKGSGFYSMRAHPSDTNIIFFTLSHSQKETCKLYQYLIQPGITTCILEIEGISFIDRFDISKDGTKILFSEKVFREQGK
ncbi:hypothetical protein ACFL4A_01480, partial [bacterium]